MVSEVRIKAIADRVRYGNFSSCGLAYVFWEIFCSFVLLHIPFAQANIYSNLRGWQATGLWKGEILSMMYCRSLKDGRSSCTQTYMVF